MKNPKLLTAAAMRIKKSEEINLTDLIEKLPGILKQDKMILKKHIKEANQSLLSILRKKNVSNIKDETEELRAQAAIRKYLSDYKSISKEDSRNKSKSLTKSLRVSNEKAINKQNMFLKEKKQLVESKFGKAILKNEGQRNSLCHLRQIKSYKNLYEAKKQSNSKSKYSLEKHKYSSKKLNFENGVKPNGLDRYSSRYSSSKNLLKETNRQEVSDFTSNIKNIELSNIRKYETQKPLAVQSPSHVMNNADEFRNLFTSPDLLEQCKFILSNLKKYETCQSAMYSSVPTSPKYSLNNNESRPHIFNLEKQKPCFKQKQTIAPYQQQSKPSHHQQSLLKKQHKTTLQRVQKVDPSTRKAQYIFDSLFSDSHIINFQLFSEIINQQYSTSLDLYRLFQRADTTHSGIVDIYSMGKHLEQAFGSQQNYVRNIFDLIDLDRKEYITQSDISNFVHQIVDHSFESETEIKEMFMRAIRKSDFKKNNKIEYWALYYIKNSEQFKQLVEYVSHFEFEVEC